MDFNGLLALLGTILTGYVPPFLFVLTIVVFFHELGHFLVARWCGVNVKVFSIGFGPEIFGWYDKYGTRWRMSWIPLGGYVRFLDDDGAASTPNRQQIEAMSDAEKAGSFHLKPVGSRAAVVAAGPIANFILAIVIFTLTFWFIGREVTEARVDQVAPDSAAAAAGFRPGDLIKSIDGEKINDFNQLQRIVSGSAERVLMVVVERDGAELTLTATPQWKEITDRFGNKQKVGLLGITRNAGEGGYRLETYGLADSFKMALKETWFVVARTFEYLYDIVVGRQDADQLGGPLRIAQASGQVATLGILALIQLAAFLSVSIGLLNLFPVPLLDGGHLVFYAIEAVRGRPLSEQSQEWGFRIGLALVLALMFFATWNDIVHFGAL